MLFDISFQLMNYFYVIGNEDFEDKVLSVYECLVEYVFDCGFYMSLLVF